MARVAASWIEAATNQLNRLEEPHKAKKRTTITALIRARVEGVPESEIWDRPDVCNKTTYYRKWRQDPLFADVLATVEKIALDFIDREHLIATQRANQILQISSPDAAQKLSDKLNDPDPNVAIRAAVAILDRAHLDEATGPKETGNALTFDNWQRAISGRRDSVNEMLEVFDEEDIDGAHPQGGDHGD